MSESSSAYGKGFAIRMVVLLALLAAVAIGFFKDKELQEANGKKIDEIYAMAGVDRGLYSQNQVREAVGMDPAETKTTGKYSVDKFVFSRVVPFVNGRFIEVAYDKQGNLYEVSIDTPFKDRTEDLLAGVKMMPEGERTMPAAAMGGGGGGGGAQAGGGRGNADPDAIVKRIMESDADEDGKLSKDEVPDRMKERFDDMDADKDGLLTEEEVKTAIEARMNRRNEESESEGERPAGDEKASDESEKGDQSQAEEKKDESEGAGQEDDKSGDSDESDKSGDSSRDPS